MAGARANDQPGLVILIVGVTVWHGGVRAGGAIFPRDSDRFRRRWLRRVVSSRPRSGAAWWWVIVLMAAASACRVCRPSWGATTMACGISSRRHVLGICRQRRDGQARSVQRPADRHPAQRAREDGAALSPGYGGTAAWLLWHRAPGGMLAEHRRGLFFRVTRHLPGCWAWSSTFRRACALDSRRRPTSRRRLAGRRRKPRPSDGARTSHVQQPRPAARSGGGVLVYAEGATLRAPSSKSFTSSACALHARAADHLVAQAGPPPQSMPGMPSAIRPPWRR